MKIKSLAKDIFLTFSLALLYVSTIFTGAVISYAASPAEYLLVIVIAMLFGFCLVSEKRIRGLLRWLCSFPFAFMVFQYFWKTNYAVRALNWCFPGYGKQSAGGGFAGALMTIILSLSCAICGIIAVSIKPEENRELAKKQLPVIAAADVIIIILVLLMESQFPPLSQIHQ